MLGFAKHCCPAVLPCWSSGVTHTDEEGGGCDVRIPEATRHTQGVLIATAALEKVKGEREGIEALRCSNEESAGL